MRKRDRAYSKMQKHGNKGKYRDKFKMLKHLAQKKTREVYWNYISDIIAPVDSTNERPNPKKFFTYLKSIRKESNPVLCLIVHLGMYLLTWSFTKVLNSFHIVSMSLLFLFFYMIVSEKASTSPLMES
jgi:hypothetical protein